MGGGLLLAKIDNSQYVTFPPTPSLLSLSLPTPTILIIAMVNFDISNFPNDPHFGLGQPPP